MEDEFISQLIEWMRNNPITDEDRNASLSNNIMRGSLNPMFGIKHTDETKRLIGQKAKGREKPKGWGERHAAKLRGRKHSLESRMKRGMKGKDNPMFGKKWTDEQKRQRTIKMGMKVTIKGIEYASKREAAKALGVSRPTIDNWVRNGQ